MWTTLGILFSLMSMISADQNSTEFQNNTLQSYNQNDAITYIYASALAFCDLDKIKKSTCGPVCDYLYNYQVMAAQETDCGQDSITYVILYDKNTRTLIITFRGTITVDQLVHQLTGGKGVPYKLHSIDGALVTEYFYYHYRNDVRSLFMPDFNKFWSSYKRSVKKIIFTGHSLGAAITQHAAADLVFSNTINTNSYDIQMYPSGSPRVGNYEFVSKLHEKIPVSYRVVHYQDIVPHLPPCNAFKYEENGACKKSGLLKWYPYHLPQEIWYNSDFSSYQTCDRQEGEDIHCSDGVKVSLSVSDHLVYFGVYVGHCALV